MTTHPFSCAKKNPAQGRGKRKVEVLFLRNLQNQKTAMSRKVSMMLFAFAISRQNKIAPTALV